MKKQIILTTVLSFLLSCIVNSNAFAWTYINWEERAGGTIVTSYKDESVITSDSSSITVGEYDELYDYSIAAIDNYDYNGECIYDIQFNVYHILNRFETENITSFSFTVTAENKDKGVFLLKNGVRIDSAVISSLGSVGKIFRVFNKKILLTGSTSDESGSICVTVFMMDDSQEAWVTATFDQSLGYVLVEGFVPEETNTVVSIVVVNKNDITDIGCIEETRSGEKHRFSKALKLLKDPSLYKVMIGYEGNRYEIENIDIINSGAEQSATLNLIYEGGVVEVSVIGNEAFYGLNQDCRIIIAYYGENNTLLSVMVSDSWSEIKDSVPPEDSLKVKCFTWEDLNTLTPLTDTKEIEFE